MRNAIILTFALLFALFAASCSNEESCPPGTPLKLGKCKDSHQDYETGDFEDPPPDPDPYNETPHWPRCQYAFGGEAQAWSPIDDEWLDEIYGTTIRQEVEFCPFNPAHHVGDPWPAKPYAANVPKMPSSSSALTVPPYPNGYYSGWERSRMISNFGIYAQGTPSVHPRAPLYSPFVWQPWSEVGHRARYNVVGPPCYRDDNVDYFGEPIHVDGHCMSNVSDWGVAAGWPLFPLLRSWEQSKDVAKASATCIASGTTSASAYNFMDQSIATLAANNHMQGLVYLNGSTWQHFNIAVLTGVLTQAIGGELWAADFIEEITVWIDYVNEQLFWPNCDPDDAEALFAPSVRCAMWSHTGVCGYEAKLSYVNKNWSWNWYSDVACPGPFFAVMPTFTLTLPHDASNQPIGETTIRGWCTPYQNTWMGPGGTTPPPWGIIMDVIKLPEDETGYERGYLLNQDNLTLEKLMTWSSQVEFGESPDGVVLRYSTDVAGSRTLFSLFDLEDGDTIAAIGTVDLRGAGGEALLMQTINDRYINGIAIDALVLRGNTVLPTYVMRASYAWMGNPTGG